MPDKTADISLFTTALSQRVSRYARPALAVSSGVLLALAFPYPSLWPFAFLAVPLMLKALDGAGLLAAAAIGWLTGFIFFLVLAYWLSVFGVSVLVLLSGFMALYFVIFGIGARSLLKRASSWGRLLGIPAFWVVVEYARSTGTYSFPWGVIGESVKGPVLMQAASVVGGFGLSFLVVLCGVGIYQAWQGGVFSSLKQTALVLIVVLSWSVFGVYSLAGPVPKAATEVALLQGNIPQDLKLSSKGIEMAKNLYLQMTERAAAKGPDLIIWPETAVPNELLYDPSYVEEITKAATDGGAILLAGAFDRDGDKVYNAAFLLGNGEPSAYRKIHLVPWGEFTPLPAISTKVNSLAGLGVDQTPGKDLVPLSVGDDKLATVICFESAYSMLMADMARSGAKVGIVITNDGWFGETSAADQHFELARFRAIENGFYVVQAANTGISGIIDPKGRVLAKTRLNERTVLSGRIGYRQEYTLYSTIAGALPFLYAAVAGFSLQTAWRKRENAST